MADKSQLGYSKIGKGLTGIEQLNIGPNGLQIGANFQSIVVSDSFVIPTQAPNAANRQNGSIYYDAANNRLYLYDPNPTQGTQWVYFTPAGSI